MTSAFRASRMSVFVLSLVIGAASQAWAIYTYCDPTCIAAGCPATCAAKVACRVGGVNTSCNSGLAGPGCCQPFGLICIGSVTCTGTCAFDGATACSCGTVACL